MTQNEPNILESGGLSELSKAYLLETVRWTRFLAIMGFIFLGLMLLAAVFFMVSGSLLAAYSTELAGLGTTGVGVLYLVAVLLYFYPIYALTKFSSCIKKGIRHENQELITEGFRYQKNMYKFIGILMIIVLVLYLLIIIFGGLAAVMS